MDKPRLLYGNAMVLFLTPLAAAIIVPLYGYRVGYDAFEWWVFAIFMLTCGCSSRSERDVKRRMSSFTAVIDQGDKSAAAKFYSADFRWTTSEKKKKKKKNAAKRYVAEILDIGGRSRFTTNIDKLIIKDDNKIVMKVQFHQRFSVGQGQAGSVTWDARLTWTREEGKWVISAIKS